MGKHTDLNHEGGEIKGVVVEHDAADITDDLGDATEDHTHHEAPTPPSDTKDCVGDANESEESEESSVGRERWSVLVYAPFDGAAIEVASSVGTEGDDTRGKFARHVD